MLQLDFYNYNPTTERFDRQPPDGNVLKGNLCPEANPTQPFWDLTEITTIIHDDDVPRPYDGPPPSCNSPSFWRNVAHTLWANATPNQDNANRACDGETCTPVTSTNLPQCASPKRNPQNILPNSAEPDSTVLHTGLSDVDEFPSPYDDPPPEGLSRTVYGGKALTLWAESTPAASPFNAMSTFDDGSKISLSTESVHSEDFPHCVSPKDIHRMTPEPTVQEDSTLVDEDLFGLGELPTTITDQASPFAQARDECFTDEDESSASVTSTSDTDSKPLGEWEAFKIIGEETIHDVKHYMVAWKPTLEPENNLGHLAALISEWKKSTSAAPSRVQPRGPRKIRIKLRTGQSDGNVVHKRGRGRPRKFT